MDIVYLINSEPIATCKNADSVSEAKWYVHPPFDLMLPFFTEDIEVYTEVDNILSIENFGDLREKILGVRNIS